MLHDKWLTARLAYLRGLEAPSYQQQQLLVLADKLERTTGDSVKLTALVRAEAAVERAQKVKAQAARIVADDEEAVRLLEADRETIPNARNRELCNVAELLILAGLVDCKTGLPVFDRGELLGALVGLAKVPGGDPRRSEWKRVGDALLAQRGKQG